MAIQCLDKEWNFVGFGTTEATNKINGSNDWRMYNASVFETLNTKLIDVRLSLSGIGKVWFDDVKLIVK